MDLTCSIIFIFYRAVFEQHSVNLVSVFSGHIFDDKFADELHGDQASSDEKKYIPMEL